MTTLLVVHTSWKRHIWCGLTWNGQLYAGQSRRRAVRSYPGFQMLDAFLRQKKREKEQREQERLEMEDIWDTLHEWECDQQGVDPGPCYIERQDLLQDAARRSLMRTKSLNDIDQGVSYTYSLCCKCYLKWYNRQNTRRNAWKKCLHCECTARTFGYCYNWHLIIKYVPIDPLHIRKARNRRSRSINLPRQRANVLRRRYRSLIA